MGNTLIARELIIDLSRRDRKNPDLVLQLYDSVPLDFRVYFTPHLPLFADRFGMTGITVDGSVYLLSDARHYAPARLLALLRHEAEHVRQQRETPLLFYPRYIGEWLRYLSSPIWSSPVSDSRSVRRTFRAYRSISFEREAYHAGEAFAARYREINEEPD